LVLPFPGAQLPINIDLAAFFEIFAYNLSQPLKKHHSMPLGALLWLSGFLVFPRLGGGNTYVGHRVARWHVVYFWILSKISDKNDLVNSSCHGRLLFDMSYNGFRCFPLASCLALGTMGVQLRLSGPVPQGVGR